MEGEEREEAVGSACTYGTRGESKDSSTTWLWQSVSAVPQHCLTAPLCHLVANVKRRQLLWKTRENRHKWFCPTRASPSSRSRCHTGNRLGAQRNPPFPTRNARCHDQSSSGVPVEVKAVRNVVSGDRHKLPKPIGKRDCQRWGSACVFRTVCQRAAHFLPYCPNAMTFKTSVTSTQSWHCTCFSAHLLSGAKEPKIFKKKKKKKKTMHVYYWAISFSQATITFFPCTSQRPVVSQI